MIHYDSGCGVHYVLKILQLKGSVFPKSFCVALPCALITVALKIATDQEWFGLFMEADEFKVLNDAGGFSGFGFLVGFLIVFRTSQAYSRFWDGCIFTHQMCAEWFDACSALCAFCVHSQASEEVTEEFQHLVVRLFSILHAVALAEIEDTSKDDIHNVHAFHMELIDVRGVDMNTLQRIKDSTCKVELVFTWIQQLITANIATGVMAIPAPLLTRCFQELSNGMVAFHQAMKITLIPFPFPYAQTCDCLLMIHWIIVPVVVAQWASGPVWAAVFSFIQVFILWSLNFIAVEIENPFGRDDNDLDAAHMQRDLNRQLTMLTTLTRSQIPRLTSAAVRSIDLLEDSENREASTFASVWEEMLGQGNATPVRTVKRRECRTITATGAVLQKDSGWRGPSGPKSPQWMPRRTLSSPELRCEEDLRPSGNKACVVQVQRVDGLRENHTILREHAHFEPRLWSTIGEKSAQGGHSLAQSLEVSKQKMDQALPVDGATNRRATDVDKSGPSSPTVLGSSNDAPSVVAMMPSSSTTRRSGWSSRFVMVASDDREEAHEARCNGDGRNRLLLPCHPQLVDRKGNVSNAASPTFMEFVHDNGLDYASSHPGMLCRGPCVDT